MKYLLKILLLSFIFPSLSGQVKCQNISSKYFNKLPREVELQGPYLDAKVNSLRDSHKKQPQLSVSNNKQSLKDNEVIQQVGLNDRIPSSYKTYFRYMIGSHLEYETLNEYSQIKSEFKKDIKSTAIYFGNILKKQLEKSIDCDDGCTFRYLVGDTSMINGYIAVPVVFSRKSKLERFKDQEVVTTMYLIPTTKKIYYIRYSYLKYQESIWHPIIRQLNNTINLN
jgi:hypothetical protein